MTQRRILVALCAALAAAATGGVALAVTQGSPQGRPFTRATYARNVLPQALPASVVHVDLDAGSYTLTGKVVLVNNSPGQAIVGCGLEGDTPDIVMSAGQELAMPMVSAATLTAPGQVGIFCATRTPGATVLAYGAGLVASSVDTLTGP